MSRGFRIEPFTFDYVRDIDPVTKAGIFRPRIPCRLQNDSKEFLTPMLVDSGADYSSIPFEIAETLRLNLGQPKTNIGPNRKFESYRTDADVWIYPNKKQTYIGRIPIVVPAGRQEDAGDLPLLCLLGRKPFFDMYDVTFYQSKLRVRFEPSSKFAPPPPPPSKIKSDK